MLSGSAVSRVQTRLSTRSCVNCQLLLVGRADRCDRYKVSYVKRGQEINGLQSLTCKVKLCISKCQWPSKFTLISCCFDRATWCTLSNRPIGNDLRRLVKNFQRNCVAFIAASPDSRVRERGSSSRLILFFTAAFVGPIHVSIPQSDELRSAITDAHRRNRVTFFLSVRGFVLYLFCSCKIG